MSQPIILLADDDELIVDVLRNQLEREGYAVAVAGDGLQAVALARTAQPDLVLLDVMMPGLLGWDVCREIRRFSDAPILMLSARGEEMDRILGLELGADDYIVKPFSFRELVARIRANLRRMSVERSPVDAEPVERMGPIQLDRKRHLVSRNGQDVTLTKREYDLLLALIDGDGAVMSRDTLLDQVWGEEWVGDSRTVDVHIRWLREKLESDPGQPRLILTVRGSGYRLAADGEDA
jgi:DNA-binding response OmpR family regulator